MTIPFRKPARYAHPLVAVLMRESKRQGRGYEDLAKEAGVAPNTIYGWRRQGRIPNLANIDAVLTVLGYRLTIEKIGGPSK